MAHPRIAKEVNSIAKKLSKEISMPLSSRTVVLDRLKRLLPQAEFKRKMRKAPITGVFAYQMGEGGFIVKVKEGKGKVVFQKEVTPQQIPAELWYP